MIWDFSKVNFIFFSISVSIPDTTEEAEKIQFLGTKFNSFISNPSNHFIPQYYSKIDKVPKTYVSSLSIQTVNINRQKPTNRNPLRELNLQTNQTKYQISIASNIETCSNQLSPKKRGRKRLPRDENVLESLKIKRLKGWST
ncbi:hypothetical protein BpHYR1_027841 [Brachionus plicatilis]|uniref:Uncharacterized protein n=1 Tax=Brachionus plicatilis TaxID=10195 RepID=A0A3M7RYX9_BRAPC|nr:hypothetical protein BpHYR1_027841 [Brachionus plicatilis]